MSLFGDDTAPASTNNLKSSLFAEDTPAPRTKSGSGLFADDDGADDNSPWGFQPTPKKPARASVVKTLLPASDVPDSYIDAFDTIRANGDRTASGVSFDAAKALLNSAKIGENDQQRIMHIIAGAGSSSTDGLGRGEFNVLLALIGLAQEGEELSLDGVDERKNRLPQPTLPSLTLRPATPPPPPPSQSKPAEQPIPTPSAQSNGQARASRKQSFGFPDTDPWASPAPTRTNGINKNEAAAPARSTSAYSSHVGGGENTTSGSSTQHIQTTTGSNASDWTQYGGSVSGYTTSGLGGSTFGGSGDEDGDDGPKPLSKYTRRPRLVSHGAEEEIMITSLPDKEGMFLFQYRNYEVTAARRNSKVVRRYSDFVWLLDCLHKKYTFRQLPLLPPKRVAINGNYIAADALFIEKRRRGLARFANALVRHPVLSQEQLVVMFLTVPTELSVWRKQATITVMEEFTGKPLPPTLEDSLPSTLEDLFETIRAGVRRSADSYINLCAILERLIKRKDGLAGEYSRFSSVLSSVTEANADTYRIDVNDVPLLNEGINATAKHIATSHGLLVDEARAWDEGALEDFKRQRDALVSMRDMFDRKDRFAKDNIPTLEKRILSNEAKLGVVRAKPEGLKKPGEAEKLEEAIMKDKESIIAQHARGVFIKECIRDEIQIFQSSQYHISRMLQEWSAERVKFAEMQADCWRTLTNQVESMPLDEE